MQAISKIIISIILSAASYISAAQNTWLWAESIDRSSTWNEPYYKPYNTVDKLLSYRDDSAAYCMDCSLPNLLWKGIEANKIAIYQLDKKSKLSIQKLSQIKTVLFAPAPIKPEGYPLSICEIIIYRRPDTTISNKLSDLSIEWIGLNFRFERDTFMIYLKSQECFSYLKSNACMWVHPLNQHIKISMVNALMQRQYLIRYSTIVSAANLKMPAIYNTNLPPFAKKLKENDTHTSAGKLECNTDTLLIRLQAIYSADIRDKLNRGFNKAHIIEYVLKLHAENKIKGYAYHQAGYFTIIEPRDFSEHLFTYKFEDEELVYKHAPVSALTSLHILKTYTKISNSNSLTTDWMIFGLSEESATTYNNTYAIAFKFEDVLAALSTTNIMWYNGVNQQDSTRLDEALRRQYISYNQMTIYSVYKNTVASFTKDIDTYRNTIWNYPTSASLYEYTAPIVSDLNEIQKRMLEKKRNEQITTYQLHYTFTSETNSALTKNTLLIDALLDAIRTNKITVYSDEGLTQLSTSTSALNKLDKTRFYKTGNIRKDSIYISKIPVEDRFIKNSDLKEFTLSSTYSTIKKKSVNQGSSFGIFIPAELNPQYDTDTLCYVSYNEFLRFLQKNKLYKKISPQFAELLNECAIVSVEDFYDIVVYAVTEENAEVPAYLPAFVRERIAK